MTSLLIARPAFRPFTSARQPALAWLKAGGAKHTSRTARPQRHVALRAVASAQASASTAKDAVERGLEEFQAGRTEAALALFLQAQQLQPDRAEAQAAYYNAACAYTKLRQWQRAVDCITKAVNDYNLQLTVAINDPDLAPLRERREWLTGLALMRGGITDQQYMQLRSEAKAPFRLARIIFVGGLAVGAALGLFIITARLIGALKGGEGAPDLQETLQNFAINSVALAALTFFVYRDVSSQNRDQQVVMREEALGQLQIALGNDRVIPLAAFRGTTRPVIIAGSRGQLLKALALADTFQKDMRYRGVSLVPIQLSGEDLDEKLRQLKADLNSSGGANSSGSRGFAPAPDAGRAADAGKAAAAADEAAEPAGPQAASGLSKKDRKWQLKAHDEAEWVQWLQQQKKAAGITDSDLVYVQVQLDGTVRASGAGNPPWQKFLGDIPELDSVRTKFTDGVGR